MATKGDSIHKMWRVPWKDAAGAKHYREVWSATEAATLLRKQTEAGGVPIGEPVELDDRWGVRWRDSRGHGHKRVLERERAAKDLLREEQNKRARGEWHDPREARRTLAEVYEMQTASQPYAASTLELRDMVWRKHLAPQIGDAPIGKADTARIEAVLASIEAPEMRRKGRALLNTLFNYALEQKPPWLTVNPVPKQRRGSTRAERMERKNGSTRDRKRFLVDAELARLLAELPERWRVMVELKARVGLRPGEAFGLMVGKLTQATEVPQRKPATLLIDTSLSGFTKTGEPRTLTLPAVVAERLTEHLRRTYGEPPWDSGAPMFPKQDGTPIASKNSASAWRRRIFTPSAIRAGLGEGFTPNMLRHSAAAFAIANGGDVYSVQRMLGHAHASITLDTYGSLWDSSAERLAERLDQAIRQGAVATPAPADVVEIGRGGA